MSDLALFAYVGEDEFGSGEVGLKQAHTPSGLIPLVATREAKMDQTYIKEQLQAQANAYGKTIRLVRFAEAETVLTIEPEAKS